MQTQLAAIFPTLLKFHRLVHNLFFLILIYSLHHFLEGSLDGLKTSLHPASHNHHRVIHSLSHTNCPLHIYFQASLQTLLSINRFVFSSPKTVASISSSTASIHFFASSTICLHCTSMFVQYCGNSPFPPTETLSIRSVYLRSSAMRRKKLSRSFISTNITGSSGKIDSVNFRIDSSQASTRFRIYSSPNPITRTVSNSFGTAGRFE